MTKSTMYWISEIVPLGPQAKGSHQVKKSVSVWFFSEGGGHVRNQTFQGTFMFGHFSGRGGEGCLIPNFLRNFSA